MANHFSGREETRTTHLILCTAATSGLSKGDGLVCDSEFDRQRALISVPASVVESSRSSRWPAIVSTNQPRTLWRMTWQTNRRRPPRRQNLSRKQLIDLLNEDLAREYQAIIAYVVYSQVLKGAQYMNIAGRARGARQGRARSCADDRQADRLPGWNAGRDAQAGQDLGQGGRHAPLRPGQRKRDDPQLPRCACASARRWASMPSPSRSARSWSRSKSTRSTWRPRWAWMCRM